FGGGQPQPMPQEKGKGKTAKKDDGFPGQPGAKGGFKDTPGSPMSGPQSQTLLLREYAHVHSPVAVVQQDMVLWHPLLIAEDGTAAVAFDLSGKATTYRVTIYGHTRAGRLGVYHGKLETSR